MNTFTWTLSVINGPFLLLVTTVTFLLNIAFLAGSYPFRDYTEEEESIYFKRYMRTTVFLSVLMLCLTAYYFIVQPGKMSPVEMEQRIRSEMSYRLGKESQPNNSVFTYMSDQKLIDRLEKLRENKREINLALENQSGKIFLKASGSLKGKQSKIEQAMENKERIQLDEFLKTATIEEKEAYVEVLKQRKEQVDNLLERIKKEAGQDR